jgi:hypothetical protein
MPEHRRPKVLHAGEGLRLDVQGILFTYKATSVEEFFEHMSVLAKTGPPDLKKMKELAERYQIEFLPSPHAG